MNNYFSVGKIAATFGLGGEVILQHALGQKTDLKGLTVLFLEEGAGVFLPFFIEATRLKNDTEVYIKLEGYNSKESAQRLTRRQVWLQKADFDKFVAKASPISLLGYSMINKGKVLGDVIEVIEQPMQVLCKIMYNGNEALIPIHQESLQHIDPKKRQVVVALPEGLLDIYS